MLLPDVLDVGVTVTLVSSPLLLRVCIVWVHICVTRDPSIGGAEEGEGGREGEREEYQRRTLKAHRICAGLVGDSIVMSEQRYTTTHMYTSTYTMTVFPS